MNKEPLKIMLIAPENRIDVIIPDIPQSWNIIVTSSLDDCNEKLVGTEAMIVADDQVIGTDLLSFFNGLKVKNHHTKIVLILHQFENIDAINLFNKGIIHKVLHSTSTNINEILQSTAREFINEIEHEKTEKLFSEGIENSAIEFISEDKLLDLSLMLADTEIKDFTKQFVSIVQGIQSFIAINFNIFEDMKSEAHKNNIFEYLSDLELLSNQYDQRILMIYVEIVKSYFHLYLSMIDDAMFHYKSCVRIFYWLSNEYIDEVLVDNINNFPLMEDEYYYIKNGEKEFDLTNDKKDKIRQTLDKLLNYDILKLTNLSKSLYQFLQVDSDILSSILVVRQSLPLYVFQNTGKALDPTLVSGFVDAFSSFLQELVDGKGDMDHIQHDKGVILIHREKNIRFLLLAKQDEVFLRIGLRQFAKETAKTFEEIPAHEQVSDDEGKVLELKIRQLFKLENS